MLLPRAPLRATVCPVFANASSAVVSGSAIFDRLGCVCVHQVKSDDDEEPKKKKKKDKGGDDEEKPKKKRKAEVQTKPRCCL